MLSSNVAEGIGRPLREVDRNQYHILSYLTTERYLILSVLF